jgi:hypothetical protein
MMPCRQEKKLGFGRPFSVVFRFCGAANPDFIAFHLSTPFSFRLFNGNAGAGG